MKTCTKCHESKPTTEFTKNGRFKDGKQPWCRKCMKANSVRWARENPDRVKEIGRASYQRNRSKILSSRLGISVEQFEHLTSQPCELCNSTVRVVVDHCHSTGRVRGSLCTQCNTAIGKLGDTVEALERVVAYLRRGLME